MIAPVRQYPADAVGGACCPRCERPARAGRLVTRPPIMVGMGDLALGIERDYQAERRTCAGCGLQYDLVTRDLRSLAQPQTRKRT